MPPLLRLQNVRVEFDSGWRKPALAAVDDVSFNIEPRETVGLVGESGSGKTTIGRAILGLVPVSGGSIFFHGVDITHAGDRRRRALSTEMQVVFQDPFSSLNPVRTIGQTLAESLHSRTIRSRQDVNLAVTDMLARVGLPATAARRYPREFSGGQRQRIAIARALVVRPSLVICDEPTSSLDLSVQAQIMNLLRELQSDLGVAYLFISHNLAVVRHMAKRTIVLYRGQVMEAGDTNNVYEHSMHPYTRTLLSAIPVADPEVQRARRAQRRADLDSERHAGDHGCPFASRCVHAISLCLSQRPRLETTLTGSVSACHRWRELYGRPVSEVRAVTG